MRAPVAIQPLAGNDSRPARPVVFQSHHSALTHATRSARLASVNGAYRTVAGVAHCFEPVEGGIAFRCELGVLNEWFVFVVVGTGLARLKQQGLRSAVETCERKARAHDLAANASKPGSAVYRLHTQYADEERERARELEMRLTVSRVQL